MNRTFEYKFTPTKDDPVKDTVVEIPLQAIEDAGLKEVLQTPGVKFGSWNLLEALLEPRTSEFIFREPLGEAREVKVALSGLFGRFVARAYLERHIGLSIFAHLGRRSMVLDGRLGIKVKRLRSGDLPDWVAASSDLSSIAIAEAKGCHDRPGPERALARAWDQAQRVDILTEEGRISVKRYAIATRWGSTIGGAPEAQIAVHDPQDDGERFSQDEMEAALVGILRAHVANLIAPLGHQELARELLNIVTAPSQGGVERAKKGATELLERGSAFGSASEVSAHYREHLIGGTVTRAGPLIDRELDEVGADTLSRYNLRPTFVGVDRKLVLALVSGDISSVRYAMETAYIDDISARKDGAGGFVIPLGVEGRSMQA